MVVSPVKLEAINPPSTGINESAIIGSSVARVRVKVSAISGIVRLVREGRVGESETVVVLATGSGLKDVDAVLERTEVPASIEADSAASESEGKAEVESVEETEPA